MSYRENDNFREHLLIHNAERKPVQRVPPEFTKVARPTLRSLFDRLHCFTHCLLKVRSQDHVTIPIPTKRLLILALGFRMEPNRLTGHRAETALFSEPHAREPC